MAFPFRITSLLRNWGALIFGFFLLGVEIRRDADINRLVFWGLLSL